MGLSMSHEPRCIEIPCTCVTILREELRVTAKYLEEAVQKVNTNYEEVKRLRKKIQDGLSCCCAGCTKHNQALGDVEKTPQEKADEAYAQIKRTQELNQRLKDIGVSVDPVADNYPRSFASRETHFGRRKS